MPDACNVMAGYDSTRRRITGMRASLTAFPSNDGATPNPSIIAKMTGLGPDITQIKTALLINNTMDHSGKNPQTQPKNA